MGATACDRCTGCLGAKHARADERVRASGLAPTGYVPRQSDDALCLYAVASGAGEGRFAQGIADTRMAGLHFEPGTDPRWTWFDERATPTEFLQETYAARASLLNTYGQNALTQDGPLGSLRDARVGMVYLHHR